MTKPVDPKKPEQLDRGKQIENILFGFATMSSILLLGAVWTVRMWVRSYSRWHKKYPDKWFRPQLPKVVDVWVIGKANRAYLIQDILKAYHVRNFVFSYNWNVQEGYVGMSVMLLVNPSQYDKIDSYLFNNSNGYFDIQSRPGTLRDVQFTPHAQAAQRPQPKRQASPARKPAKLGGTYGK